MHCHHIIMMMMMMMMMTTIIVMETPKGPNYDAALFPVCPTCDSYSWWLSSSSWSHYTTITTPRHGDFVVTTIIVVAVVAMVTRLRPCISYGPLILIPLQTTTKTPWNAAGTWPNPPFPTRDWGSSPPFLYTPMMWLDIPTFVSLSVTDLRIGHICDRIRLDAVHSLDSTRVIRIVPPVKVWSPPSIPSRTHKSIWKWSVLSYQPTPVCIVPCLPVPVPRRIIMGFMGKHSPPLRPEQKLPLIMEIGILTQTAAIIETCTITNQPVRCRGCNNMDGVSIISRLIFQPFQMPGGGRLLEWRCHKEPWSLQHPSKSFIIATNLNHHHHSRNNYLSIIACNPLVPTCYSFPTDRVSIWSTIPSNTQMLNFVGRRIKCITMNIWIWPRWMNFGRLSHQEVWFWKWSLCETSNRGKSCYSITAPPGRTRGMLTWPIGHLLPMRRSTCIPVTWTKHCRSERCANNWMIRIRTI